MQVAFVGARLVKSVEIESLFASVNGLEIAASNQKKSGGKVPRQLGDTNTSCGALEVQ